MNAKQMSVNMWCPSELEKDNTTLHETPEQKLLGTLILAYVYKYTYSLIEPHQSTLVAEIVDHHAVSKKGLDQIMIEAVKDATEKISSSDLQQCFHVHLLDVHMRFNIPEEQQSDIENKRIIEDYSNLLNALRYPEFVKLVLPPAMQSTLTIMSIDTWLKLYPTLHKKQKGELDFTIDTHPCSNS